MKKTYTSCDFGINYVREGRVDIIARGIEKCMNSLGIPLKVVGTLLPELHKLDIRFENKDQEYLASSISMDLDYLMENKQNKSKWEVITAGAVAGKFSISTSRIDLIAKGMEKCLRQFYSFGKQTNVSNMAPFEGLKNITVTAREYHDIKHHGSYKHRFMIEFDTGESITRKENREDTLENIYWKYALEN